MQTGVRRVRATLELMVTAGADAISIADAASTVWRDVATTLSPIIGQHGAAALYMRSLQLTRSAHPCLSALHDAEDDMGDFTALHEALSSQTSSGAAAANDALLNHFYDILSGLIGPALAERLLLPALDKPSTPRAEQAPNHDIWQSRDPSPRDRRSWTGRSPRRRTA